jgi:hypothetical protein
MRSLILLSGILVLGCAAAPEPPPSVDHPANPHAASAPLPEASTTLEVEASADTVPATVPAAAPAEHADHSQHQGHPGHEGHGK